LQTAILTIEGEHIKCKQFYRNANKCC